MKNKTLNTILYKLNRLKDAIFGSYNYGKFVVITRSRTGSNLLISLLDSHPNVQTYGEIFSRLNGQTARDIWSYCFSKKSRKLKYLGFKIFYYHPQDSEDQTVWNYILEDKNIKIIHLTRDNMLRTVVSNQVAHKTDAWVNHDPDLSEDLDKRIELNVDECLKEFKKIKEWENNTRDKFRNHDIFEMSYEELAIDRQKSADNVFKFLSLPSSKVNTTLQKQNKERLEDLILNYEAVRAALQNTKWSYLLQLEE